MNTGIMNRTSTHIARTEDPAEHPRGIDLALLVTTLLLVGLGVIMVFSASAVLAGDRFGDPWHYLKRQALFALMGIGLMAALAHTPYRLYRSLVYPLLAITGVLLLLVLIPGVGASKGGATRWLAVGPISFQPSELARLSLIFYLAYSLDKKQANIKSFSIGILPHLVIAGFILSLILLEPDFGTTVTLALILFLMMFLAGVRLKHLGALLLAALPVFVFVMVGAAYRLKRLTTFIDPWNDPVDAGFQIIQSWIAFHKGGIFGQGLGSSQQKLFYLPEAHTDFIFSVLGEELGLVGVLVVLGLYLTLVLRGIAIARSAPDLFGCLLGLGLTSWLGIQTVINIGVVLGLLPTKGLVLPFMSSGGTSLVTALAAVGILLNISASRGHLGTTYVEGRSWSMQRRQSPSRPSRHPKPLPRRVR